MLVSSASGRTKNICPTFSRMLILLMSSVEVPELVEGAGPLEESSPQAARSAMDAAAIVILETRRAR